MSQFSVVRTRLTCILAQLYEKRLRQGYTGIRQYTRQCQMEFHIIKRDAQQFGASISWNRKHGLVNLGLAQYLTPQSHLLLARKTKFYCKERYQQPVSRKSTIRFRAHQIVEHNVRC